MIASNPRCVELPVRLSQSKLWQIQRNYFANKGIQAWVSEVPFYISSNRFIAERYALLMINALQDYAEHDATLQDETFYFLELGCGTGKFSFYFLKAFERLLVLHQLTWVKYCYIATDVASKNVEYCKNNSSFVEFLNNKKIDFACFDIVHDDDLYLLNAQKKLSELLKAPLMVIANYTFDCVETDLFFHTPQGYEEIKVGLKSRYKDFNISESKHLEDLRLEYQGEKVDITHYYEDAALNAILREYHETYPGSNFYVLVPLGAIKFIKTLNALTKGHFLMIVGDKGIAHESVFKLIQNKNIASFDGCFSFSVNFCLIASYMKRAAGDALLTGGFGDFKVNVFSQGRDFNTLARVANNFTLFFETFGPNEFCAIYKEYLSNAYRFSYSGLISFLKMSEYDPDVYTVIHERLLEIQPNLEPVKSLELDVLLQKVQQNIYAINMGDDIYNLIGVFYYLQGQYDQAIPLFAKSIEVFADESASYHNLGLVYEKLGDTTLALTNYQKAYELDNTDELAKNRYAKLSGKPTYRWVKPMIKILVVTIIIAAAAAFRFK